MENILNVQCIEVSWEEEDENYYDYDYDYYGGREGE